MQSGADAPTAATLALIAVIAPVGVLGSGIVSAGIYAWLVLAAVILLGSKLLGDRACFGANTLKAKCTSISVPRPLLFLALSALEGAPVA